MKTLVIIFVKIDLVLVTAAGSKQSCHSLTSSLIPVTTLVEKYRDVSNPKEWRKQWFLCEIESTELDTEEIYLKEVLKVLTYAKNSFLLWK